MGVRLPAEYQEVEYLESTGTQYIVTDYMPVQYDEINCEFMLKTFQYGELYSLFSAGTGDYQLIFLIQYTNSINGAWCKYFASENASMLEFNPVINKWYSLIISSDGMITCDGSSARSSYGGTVNTNIHIFNRANNSSGFIGRIRKLEIINNNTKKVDLVPCYRRSDSKPGMYDLVSKTFYTNQGTGEFLVGPDIVDHISPRLMDRRRVLIAKLTSLFKNIISSETGLVSFNTNFAKPMKVTCEFSPKQEGTGDPSPENIRPISAWDGANIEQRGKNLLDSSNFSSIRKLQYSDGMFTQTVSDGVPFGYIYFCRTYKNGSRVGNYVLDDDGNGRKACNITVNIGDIDTIQIGFLTSMDNVYVNYEVTDVITVSGTYNISYNVVTIPTSNGDGAFNDVQISKSDSSYASYQEETISIPFNNPGTYDFLPIQAGTGDPSPENVRPITPGLTLTRDDNTTLDVWGGSLTVNADGTGTITSKYYQCVYDGVNKKVNSSYLNDTYVQAGDVYCNPDGPVGREASILCDKLNVTGPYASASIYQIGYPATGALYFVFRIRLVDGSGVTNDSECKSYVNGWFQDNPTTVVYKTKEVSYQTYTLSVAETSRAFEALGLGKNLGPLYGGTATINENRSVDVIVNKAKVTYVGNASESWGKFGSGSASAFAMKHPLPNFTNVDGAIIANYLAPINRNASWSDYDNWVSWANPNVLVTGIKSITTVDAWLAYLAENPLTIVYDLKPSLFYHFDNVGQLQSFLGTNNIWSDLNGPITVEYYNNKKE